jgi:hypothetical protein
VGTAAAPTRIAFTNTTGNYAFSGVANGNYTLTSHKANYLCQPKSVNSTVSGANITGVNFTEAPSSTLFYVIDDANNLAIVDIAAKTVRIIGNTGIFLNDIAFDPTGRTLYGISGDSLYTIDQTSALPTLVGLLGVGMADTTSLVVSPTGTIYTANTYLYTVIPNTGAATLVGNGGDWYQSSGDLVFLGNQLYLSSKYSLASDYLVLLDPLTGAAKNVGLINFANVFGLATNDDVTLYGFTGTKVITIDPAIGAGTLFWNMSGMGLGTINGAANK